MNLFKLSWKNLINKPLATLLSLILFALGVGLISILLLLNRQLEEKFDKNLAGIDLVIGAKGSPLQLILCNMYHLDAPTGNVSIQDARPFMNPEHPLIKKAIPVSVGDSYKGYRIVGTTTDIVELYKAQLASGQLWEKDFEATIGAKVAEARGLKLGDTFFSSHGLVDDEGLEHSDTEPFRIVGILQATGSVIDQLILTNTQSIWKVHSGHGEEGEAHQDTVVALRDAVDQDITSLLVQYRKRNFKTLNLARNINESTNLQAAAPAIEINRLYDLMGTGEDALRTLAYIIICVSGFSIFIILFDSLRDRRYELALMRVMGASRGVLLLMIILEGLILAILGYLFGMLLSHLGLFILSDYLEEAYRYDFNALLFVKEELYLLGAALAIGIGAAIIPAVQASMTDISDTLTEA